MAKTDIWMALYINDFLGDTPELNAEESGAYLLLIFHAYKNGEVPKDREKLLRITRLYDQGKAGIIDAILGQYFFETRTGYSNKRADEERSKAEAKSEAARKSANVRWGKDVDAMRTDMRSHCEGICETDADSMRETCSSPSPSPSPKPIPPKMENPLSILIAHWNSKENLPVCKYTAIDIPNASAIADKIRIFGIDDIKMAIDNLSKYWEDEEAGYRPSSLDRFLVKSLDRWLDTAEPEKRYEGKWKRASLEEVLDGLHD